MYFATPLALSLLALLGLLGLPRRPRYFVMGNLPALAIRPPAPWYRHLPWWLLNVLLVVLVVLIADPVGGKQELYTRHESRQILLLIDTSSSMTTMKDTPLKTVKSVAETFIRQRPDSDRIGIVLFSDVASGGIFTTHHEGLIQELQRQEGIRISGTQLGVGLFKSLASFIEDTVETALWHNRHLTDAQRQQRFQATLDEVSRLARHLLHKTGDEFVLTLPEIRDQRQLGAGKVLIILSDARIELNHSHQEIIDHRQVFHLYETMGFERLYFVSVDALPSHLERLFSRHPSWKFLHIRSVSDRDQLLQAYTEIDQLEPTQSRLESRTIPHALYHYGAPAVLLLPLALVLTGCPPFRSLT